MDIQENSLTISRAARYFTLGTLQDTTTDIWFVIHGYGQLAAYFIRNFEPICTENTFIVAPEGLSRFYIDAKYDRVGASWMTKENRLKEIHDNHAFFDTLLQKIREEVKSSNYRLNFLGFSQGSATLWRWVSTLDIAINYLIFWGGNIPLDAVPTAQIRQARILFAYGKDDPIIQQNPTLFGGQKELIENLHLHPIIYEYEGVHNIPAKKLQEAIELLEHS